MDHERGWASDWEVVDGPQRENDRDVFWADFENGAGQTVRVRITGQELNDKRWGDKPESLEDIGGRTENILRAILERYAQKHDSLPSEIDARGLLNDLLALRKEFLSQTARTRSSAEENGR